MKGKATKRFRTMAMYIFFAVTVVFLFPAKEVKAVNSCSIATVDDLKSWVKQAGGTCSVYYDSHYGQKVLKLTSDLKSAPSLVFPESDSNDANIILDLNGYVVEFSRAGTDAAIDFAGRSFTILNSGAQDTSHGVLLNEFGAVIDNHSAKNGDVSLDNVRVVCMASNCYAITCREGSSKNLRSAMEMKYCTIEQKGEGGCVNVKDYAYFHLKSCKVTLTNKETYYPVVYLEDPGYEFSAEYSYIFNSASEDNVAAVWMAPSDVEGSDPGECDLIHSYVNATASSYSLYKDGTFGVRNEAGALFVYNSIICGTWAVSVEKEASVRSKAGDIPRTVFSDSTVLRGSECALRVYGDYDPHYLLSTTEKNEKYGYSNDNFEYMMGYYYSATELDILAPIDKVALTDEKFTYTGKAQTPGIIVDDQNGKSVPSKYYDVAFSKETRTKVGTYVVTITFKGPYGSGSLEHEAVTLSYDIVPKPTELTKLTAGSGSIKPKWKQKSNITGYYIRYSTNSNMSNAKKKLVTDPTQTYVTIKSLKHKKKYYVKIRTYRKVGSKAYFSSWSAKKSVKTK